MQHHPRYLISLKRKWTVAKTERRLHTEEKSRGTGKAIIALARKLLRIIYRTLKNNWVFEDFPNFVLAEQATA
jgi:hypothetical protein